MKLVHGTLRPATVIEVLEHGKIKVDAPGLFVAQDKNSCPPVYPFYGQHANSFSSVAVNDEVWVMSFEDNPLQLHWIRKDDFISTNGTLLETQSDEQVEIFMNRETPQHGHAVLMYSDSIGWQMSLNGSSIGIDKNGNIILNSGTGGTLNMPNANIATGSHTVALGDMTRDFFMQVAGQMKAAAQLLEANMLTAAIAPPFKNLATYIENNIKSLESTSFKVN